MTPADISAVALGLAVLILAVFVLVSRWPDPPVQPRRYRVEDLPEPPHSGGDYYMPQEACHPTERTTP